VASADQATLDYVRQHYGAWAAFLDIPELRSLFLKAVREKWDPTRLFGELTRQPWWKTHAEAQRAFIAEEKTDPASARAKIQARTQQIVAEASRLGFSVAPGRLASIARASLYNAWSDEQLRSALAGEFTLAAVSKTGGSPPVATVRFLASQYASAMPDTDVQQWARQLIAGTATEDTLRAWLVEQAKHKFPALAAALDSGMTVRQYAGEYVGLAQRRLGLSEDQINLADPKWQALLHRVDETGKPHALTLFEADREIMTNGLYGYDRSPDARANAASLVSSLRQTFAGA
jgi:hypothetical protein